MGRSATIGTKVGPLYGERLDGQVVIIGSQDNPTLRIATGQSTPATPQVLVFLGTECPMAAWYIDVLNEMQSRLGDRVQFIGVMSNAQDSRDDIQAYIDREKPDFPLVIDSEALIADKLAATRTPEAILLDVTGKVRYRGRIDDRWTPGGRRNEATQHDLKSAVDELLAGKEISNPQVEFVGCLIGRHPSTTKTLVGTAIEAEAPGAAAKVPTFAGGVASILYRRCASCHREGQVAPFSMREYAEIAAWAPTIKETIIQKRMPPWGADRDQGPFVHDLSLSRDEEKQILDWIDAGAPSGELTAAPPFPNFGDGWTQGTPDLIVELPEFVVPPGTKDLWPNLRASVPLDGPRWVRAVEVLPGNPKVMHHLGLSYGRGTYMGGITGDDEGDYSANERERPNTRRGEARGFPNNNAGKDRIRELLMRRMSSGGGFDLNQLGRGSGGKSGFLGAWAAGTPARVFPDNVGIPIEPVDGKLTLTAAMHYHPTSSTTERDRTRVGIYFGSGELKKVVGQSSIAYLPIILQPGEKQRVQSSWVVDEDIRIITYAPHMHFRGADMKYTAHYPDGRTEPLLYVDRYNFNFQWLYSPVEPKRIPAGTTIHMEAMLDNSSDNRHNPDPSAIVRFGPESDDEMAVGIFMYYSEHQREPPRGDLRKRFDEWSDSNRDLKPILGTVRIGRLPFPVPAALVLTEPTHQRLIIPTPGNVLEIPLGNVSHRKGTLEGSIESGFGPTTTEGTYKDGQYEATITVKTNIKNPFIRMWNEGIRFSGSSL